MECLLNGWECGYVPSDSRRSDERWTRLICSNDHMRAVGMRVLVNIDPLYIINDSVPDCDSHFVEILHKNGMMIILK